MLVLVVATALLLASGVHGQVCCSCPPCSLLSLSLFSFFRQDARQLRKQGDDALLMRRWDEAAEILSRAVASEPGNFLGYLKRSSAFIGQGKTAEALLDLDKVLELKPDHVKSRAKKGELLLAAHKFEEAIAAVNGVGAAETQTVLGSAMRLMQTKQRPPSTRSIPKC